MYFVVCIDPVESWLETSAPPRKKFLCCLRTSLCSLTCTPSSLQGFLVEQVIDFGVKSVHCITKNVICFLFMKSRCSKQLIKMRVGKMILGTEGAGKGKV